MALVMVQAFKCDVCGVEWLPRGEKFPVCCPGRECRSRKWNAGSEGLVMKPRSLGASDLGVGVGDRCIVPDQTPEESERAARKAKKARHHAELKEDCIAGLPETVPPAMLAKLQTPALDHHRACKCLRCAPPRRENP